MADFELGIFTLYVWYMQSRQHKKSVIKDEYHTSLDSLQTLVKYYIHPTKSKYQKLAEYILQINKHV